VQPRTLGGQLVVMFLYAKVNKLVNVKVLAVALVSEELKLGDDGATCGHNMWSPKKHSV
jgi:hypothetical protein